MVVDANFNFSDLFWKFLLLLGQNRNTICAYRRQWSLSCTVVLVPSSYVSLSFSSIILLITISYRNVREIINVLFLSIVPITI